MTVIFLVCFGICTIQGDITVVVFFFLENDVDLGRKQIKVEKVYT